MATTVESKVRKRVSIYFHAELELVVFELDGRSLGLTLDDARAVAETLLGAVREGEERVPGLHS